MIRCDFCPGEATDVILIGGSHHPACCGCADHTDHTDRAPLTRRLRRTLARG